MVELKVKCPNCGEEVGTGKDMDKDLFDKLLLKGSRSECPNCGQDIRWGKEDLVNRDEL
ncbi:MAG: hypothetical protein V5A79_05725 [Candidatus Bipolaricaulota bacterium]